MSDGRGCSGAQVGGGCEGDSKEGAGRGGETVRGVWLSRAASVWTQLHPELC